MKKYTDECREMEIQIDQEKFREFEEIYDAIMQEGIEENPPPETSTDQVKKRGRTAQTKAKNLLDRSDTKRFPTTMAAVSSNSFVSCLTCTVNGNVSVPSNTVVFPSFIWTSNISKL